jgi:hypothetical protein
MLAMFAGLIEMTDELWWQLIIGSTIFPLSHFRKHRNK